MGAEWVGCGGILRCVGVDMLVAVVVVGISVRLASAHPTASCRVTAVPTIVGSVTSVTIAEY